MPPIPRVSHGTSVLLIDKETGPLLDAMLNPWKAMLLCVNASISLTLES